VFPDASEDPCWHLGASDIPARWSRGEGSVILDSHFVFERFAATCAAFNAHPGQNRRLHYLTVCPTGTPAPTPHKGSPAFWDSVRSELAKLWPLPLPGIHLLRLFEGRVRLTLAFVEAPGHLPLFDATCDAFFLEGRVSHSASALARLARRGSTIALSQGCPTQFNALTKAGFHFTSIQSRGDFVGEFRVQKRTEPRACSPGSSVDRTAIVIGAGVAGTAASAALGDLGWRVSLVEREAAPAAGASGNLAAIFSPLLSMDDGHAARLSRACFLRLLQELRSFGGDTPPVNWDPCGVLQFPKSKQEESHFRNLTRKHAYPDAFVRFLEKHEAEKHVGQSLPSGGWFFQEGGWVNPPSLCLARIAAHPGITAHFCKAVQSLNYRDGQWSAIDPEGRTIATAPVLVLANAWEAARLLPNPVFLPFKKVRGQVAHLPCGAVPLAAPVLSGNGYLTPPVLGRHCLGATYDFDSSEVDLNPASHEANLQKLAQWLPDAPPPITYPPEGRVGFRSLTPDRMPMAGAVGMAPAAFEGSQSPATGSPPGLYALLGMGSRGVVWSTLLGEYLATLIDGSPSPLPLDLAKHLCPNRFAGREVRAK
jgi:tRNA 5-methylaminomethyl-2-thiouridine biosynthesis bifunctional protein